MTTPIGQPLAQGAGSTTTSVQETLDRLNTPSVLSGEGGLGSLGQADFLRLLTTQLANQDPLAPTDNEEMLAQLAQFSSLEAESAASTTLDDISAKLDALIAFQEAASGAGETAPDPAEPEPVTT